MVKEITTEEFDKEVLKQDKVVIIEFFGTWCMPCKMLSTILDNVGAKLEGKVDIFKLDVDENAELAKKYGVLTVPTILVLKDGAELEKAVGFRQEKQIMEMINQYI